MKSKDKRNVEHILIGNDLLIKIDQIVSANLNAISEKGSKCIKVVLLTGVEWTIFNNIDHSKKIIKSIPKINEQFYLLENIKGCVVKNRMGRESNVSKEIKQILDI